MGFKLVKQTKSAPSRKHKQYSIDIAKKNSKEKVGESTPVIWQTICNFLLSDWKYRFVSLDPLTFTEICYLNRTQTVQIVPVQCDKKPSFKDVITECHVDKSYRYWIFGKKWIHCYKHVNGHKYLFQTATRFLKLKRPHNSSRQVDGQFRRIRFVGQMSWRKAQAECDCIGTHLPFFTSKSDLNDFLKFVKLIKIQSAMLIYPEAVYIGLKYEVCFRCFC